MVSTRVRHSVKPRNKKTVKMVKIAQLQAIFFLFFTECRSLVSIVLTTGMQFYTSVKRTFELFLEKHKMTIVLRIHNWMFFCILQEFGMKILSTCAYNVFTFTRKHSFYNQNF